MQKMTIMLYERTECQLTVLLVCTGGETCLIRDEKNLMVRFAFVFCMKFFQNHYYFCFTGLFFCSNNSKTIALRRFC